MSKQHFAPHIGIDGVIGIVTCEKAEDRLEVSVKDGGGVQHEALSQGGQATPQRRLVDVDGGACLGGARRHEGTFTVNTRTSLQISGEICFMNIHHPSRPEITLSISTFDLKRCFDFT